MSRFFELVNGLKFFITVVCAAPVVILLEVSVRSMIIMKMVSFLHQNFSILISLIVVKVAALLFFLLVLIPSNSHEKTVS